MTHARTCKTACSRKYPRKFTLCSCTTETQRLVDQRSCEVFSEQTQLPQDKPLTGCTQRPGNISAQPDTCTPFRWSSRMPWLEPIPKAHSAPHPSTLSQHSFAGWW